MAAAQVPRVVVVHRRTEYDELLARHGTRDQARFFLESRDQSIESVEASAKRVQAALLDVQGAIPYEWRRAVVERSDLDRFLFEPRDLIAVVGQDGLVPNVAKYLDGQPVAGFNPEPTRNEGVLVPHDPREAGVVFKALATEKADLQERTMVEARLDDGQHIVALNDLFLGHRSHQSAHYEIHYFDMTEEHSSSGIVVSTGTGMTGWARSIREEMNLGDEVKSPSAVRPELFFMVREAWPSIASANTLTWGIVDETMPLQIVSHINDGGVIFGDGIEADRLDWSWGRNVNVCASDRTLHLAA